MPISTSSFGDERDDRYSEYQSNEQYEKEVMAFPGISLVQAETYLKRLGGGVQEKLKVVEGIGWQAIIDATEEGVNVTFAAHDELLDDLIRRFEAWVERGA
ncbi:MAG: hypothetical protein KF832_22215 [Caldilineaceae bacterium]|nr:hypothetical protein [Caldilineaceae bacterium]